MDGGDLMIAMPHLLFLTVVFAAGLAPAAGPGLPVPSRRWSGVDGDRIFAH